MYIHTHIHVIVIIIIIIGSSCTMDVMVPIGAAPGMSVTDTLVADILQSYYICTYHNNSRRSDDRLGGTR